MSESMFVGKCQNDFRKMALRHIVTHMNITHMLEFIVNGVIFEYFVPYSKNNLEIVQIMK